ncbi:hypothetical protein BGZ60DRAFT_248178 [Tricladium varicosporioides]|nr:hypothetical protein BGZ60DRAFT_248178 [Hymenoscyphus varicosporioides]
MQRARVRPDPVSCQSCRSKKLKCNRIQPCSNCTTRRIPCRFLVPPQEQINTTVSSHTNAELLARIETLESIVLKQKESTGALLNSVPHGVDNRRRPLLSENLGGSVVSNIYQKQDQDSRLLENVGTRDDSLLSRLSNTLTFRIYSMQEILEIQSSASAIGGLNDRTVVFPTYRVATLLLQNHEANVHHLCHILHIPTLKSLVKTFYLRFNQNQPVLPNQAALLLSLFSLSAYFYQPFNNSEVATTKQDSIHLSNITSRGALDVLDYTRRNTSGTLEDIQASILMSFVAYHLDGFSARGRLLSASALSIARELRLHQLDADDELSSKQDDINIRSLIDHEVKRRVFWQIASTDWLFSTISGPQEGMYFIHPNHVNVNVPKDFTDDEIVLGEENEFITGAQPTGMTFFLERLRLAHICREMTDTMPLETTRLMSLPYEQITSLDEKLQDFLSSLPFFFKLDSDSRSRSKALEAIYPNIAISRYCVTTEAHSRRIKLHQRFLHRQSIDPLYTYSRQACLESARVIVHAYEDLHTHNFHSTAPELMGMVVHFTHLALVVMVMDICFNRHAADEAEIKIEVKAALEMFEDGKHASPLLNRFLGSLRDVLQKHDVQFTKPPVSTTENNAASFASENMFNAFNDSANEIRMPSTQFEMNVQDPDMALDPSFDDFWQLAMQSEQTGDALMWDNLFSSLDSRPM